jgi:hypothetical protein
VICLCFCDIGILKKFLGRSHSGNFVASIIHWKKSKFKWRVDDLGTTKAKPSDGAIKATQREPSSEEQVGESCTGTPKKLMW